MRLSTIECVNPWCGREVSGDLAMYHLINQAREVGWTFFHDDETRAYCPEHSDPDSPDKAPWLVGCWTCNYEEEFDNEEDAKSDALLHECEADTWVKSPADLAEQRERRERWQRENAAKHEKERVAAQLAVAHQQDLERRARNWLRIRNTIVFWNKEG